MTNEELVSAIRNGDKKACMQLCEQVEKLIKLITIISDFQDESIFLMRRILFQRAIPQCWKP